MKENTWLPQRIAPNADLCECNKQYDSEDGTLSFEAHKNHCNNKNEQLKIQNNCRDQWKNIQPLDTELNCQENSAHSNQVSREHRDNPTVATASSATKSIRIDNVSKSRKRFKSMDDNEKAEVNLSFCGCGFLGIYHVGVASCFHEYAPQLSMHKISGSSAGALVAVAHICGNVQLAYATTDILRVAIDARARTLGPFHPSFDINANVRMALERGLPDDVHLKANGKLNVSLTRVSDGENVIINEFHSKEDVIQVLLCSCFIPFWSGLKAPKYKGVTYIDGGFSNNLLTLDEKTVTVSPFAGESDICPLDDTFGLLQVNLSNTSFSLSTDNLYRLSHALLPPPPEVLSELCEQGFADGIRFLQQMQLISCTKCLEIRSSLLVTANGEDMEMAVRYEAEAHSSSDDIEEHIILEHREQKMIQIEGSRRRDSIVSTTSQIYQHQAQNLQHKFDSDQSDCDECSLIREKALRNNSLPKQYTDRISDACNTVNKSLSNWIYSHRPIKYLSYLATPYYLPIELSLALLAKFWQTLPQIRHEVTSCVGQIVEFLIAILKRMKLQNSTSSLLLTSISDFESSMETKRLEREKDIAKRQINHKKSAPQMTINPPVNLQSGSELAPISHTNQEDSYSLKLTDDGLSVSKLSIDSATSANGTSQMLHSLDDTFDRIVDVTSKQERRILAYHFRDAKNRLLITEIFDLQNESNSNVNG